MRLNRLKLKWKIFIYLLGFCTLLLVVLWLFQTVLLTETYKLVRKQELKRAVALVEREINNPELHDIFTRIQEQSEIIIAPTREFVPPHSAKLRPAPETITEIREFITNDGRTVSLTFYALIAPVRATVATLRYQLYLISGIMTLLSVALAMIIAKRVSRPIEDITASAQALAGGRYGTRFSGKGFNEIVTLSDTLNTAAADLGRVEGLRRELMANVSHDLRTPLALIYSYAEMMNDFPSEITQDQTRLIMDETRRLATLVSDVLDLSKLQGEMEKLTLSRFNLTLGVLSTVERMHELLKNENYCIDFTYSEEVYVNADETKIDRAFYNLLINAINYAGGDRRITVAQTVRDGFIKISVTDGGGGIAESDLPYIWDRYYKGGQTHKRAVTGTGLGLSIVREIFRLHGCRYGVSSAPGQGSTFWFELPL